MWCENIIVGSNKITQTWKWNTMRKLSLKNHLLIMFEETKNNILELQQMIMVYCVCMARVDFLPFKVCWVHVLFSARARSALLLSLLTTLAVATLRATVVILSWLKLLTHLMDHLSHNKVSSHARETLHPACKLTNARYIFTSLHHYIILHYFCFDIRCFK